MSGADARWALRPSDETAEAALSRELGSPPLIARLMVNRGLREVGAAAAFLEASLSRNLRSPMLFREMPVASARLLDAVRNRERIFIYGDYDVDGITGSTALLLFLRELGIEPDIYIPHRMRDGYGLRAAALREMAERGARLVVTVDCGAAAHEEIALASSLGLDLIVCDHHQAPTIRPPALAILNPVVSDAGFPFRGLCAAGVVFYLLMGTRMRLRESGSAIPDLRRYLDLVALGTVADLVPLMEENRVFVKQGLKEIARTDRPGIRALLKVAGVDEVSAGALGFRLGPRINASGRLADAMRAVDLLSSRDPDEASRLAALLDGYNRDRQAMEEAIFVEADRMIQDMENREQRRSFVLASEGWHAGVVGIVASRLVERYFRPVFVLAVEGDLSRGSGRGIPAVNLVEALGACADLLERYGGHRMAAGLTIRTAALPEFATRFEETIARTTQHEDFQPMIVVDAVLDLDGVSMDLLEELESLEPHGPGNPRPVFVAESVGVVSSRVVGSNHLKLSLASSRSGRVLDAIGFRMAERKPQIGAKVDVLFSPEINRWEGREQIQLSLRGIRESASKTHS